MLDEYANTSSCGSIITFHKHREGLAAGDIGVICAFGAGYSAGSVIVKRSFGPEARAADATRRGTAGRPLTCSCRRPRLRIHDRAVAGRRRSHHSPGLTSDPPLASQAIE